MAQSRCSIVPISMRAKSAAHPRLGRIRTRVFGNAHLQCFEPRDTALSPASVGLDIDPPRSRDSFEMRPRRQGLGLALQDAISDSNVTVKPAPIAQRATRVSGHFLSVSGQVQCRLRYQSNGQIPRPGEATTVTFSLGELLGIGSNRGRDVGCPYPRPISSGEVEDLS